MGVRIAQSIQRLGYGLDGEGFECRQTQQIFLFCNTSSLAPDRAGPYSMGTVGTVVLSRG